MEAEGGEFQDWEVLHHISEAEPEQSSDFVGDSEGIIQTNYFSLDSLNKHMVSDDSEGLCKSLDNPGWIDPAFETQYPRKLSAVSWSDSSSDRSVDKRLGEFEGKYDVGFVQNDQKGKFKEFEGSPDVGFDKNGNFQEFEGNPDGGIVENDQNGNFQEFKGNPDVGFVQNDQNGNFGEEVDGVENMVAENDENEKKFSTDCSGISSDEMIVEGVEGSDASGAKEDETLGEESSEREASEEKGENEVSRVEEKKKKSGIVWWKFPIELLRYCVFKGPVWTVSVAAAFMGFVILGRRLYKMKKKNRDVGRRITMDDKKISPFISRAARFNEAFSVVKRVPIIRPHYQQPV